MPSYAFPCECEKWTPSLWRLSAGSSSDGLSGASCERADEAYGDQGCYLALFWVFKYVVKVFHAFRVTPTIRPRLCSRRLTQSGRCGSTISCRSRPTYRTSPSRKSRLTSATAAFSACSHMSSQSYCTSAPRSTQRIPSPCAAKIRLWRQ